MAVMRFSAEPKGVNSCNSAGWVPIPSFGASYLMSVTTLSSFLLWIFADAQFTSTLQFVRGDIGLDSFGDPLSNAISRDAHQWDAYGPRITLFYTLCLLNFCALVLVVIRMFIGTCGGRNLRDWMLVVLLLSAWMGVWASYPTLEWQALRLRARSGLYRFKAAAVPLLKRWPKHNGILPEAGLFEVNPFKGSNTIILTETPFYPSRTSFGYYISRTKAGGLRFNTRENSRVMIEYHPRGESPASHKLEHIWPYPPMLELVRVATLDANWYLAWYEVSYMTEESNHR